jgi:hypothetical protein
MRWHSKYNFMLVPLYRYVLSEIKSRSLAILFPPWRSGLDAYGLLCCIGWALSASDHCSHIPSTRGPYAFIRAVGPLEAAFLRLCTVSWHSRESNIPGFFLDLCHIHLEWFLGALAKFRKSVENIHGLLKSDKNIRHFAWRNVCSYDISLNSAWNEKHLIFWDVGKYAKSQTRYIWQYAAHALCMPDHVGHTHTHTQNM